MNPEPAVVVEVFGEGRADIGKQGDEPVRPTSGIVPILLYELCGKPKSLLVKRKPEQFLQGKSRKQKVQFAKRQAVYNRSHGVVFVLDSEGGVKELDSKRQDLEQGRDAAFPDFPMAIGVAHPCIEAWLLADGPAIRRAMELETTPHLPEHPEDLPAPSKDRETNPKTVLCAAAGGTKGELSAAEKDRIATSLNDLTLLRTRCPLGFAPFADEVDRHIRPLF